METLYIITATAVRKDMTDMGKKHSRVIACIIAIAMIAMMCTGCTSEGTKEFMTIASVLQAMKGAEMSSVITFELDSDEVTTQVMDILEKQGTPAEEIEELKETALLQPGEQGWGKVKCVVKLNSQMYGTNGYGHHVGTMTITADKFDKPMEIKLDTVQNEKGTFMSLDTVYSMLYGANEKSKLNENRNPDDLGDRATTKPLTPVNTDEFAVASDVISDTAINDYIDSLRAQYGNYILYKAPDENKITTEEDESDETPDINNMADALAYYNQARTKVDEQMLGLQYALGSLPDLKGFFQAGDKSVSVDTTLGATLQMILNFTTGMTTYLDDGGSMTMNGQNVNMSMVEAALSGDPNAVDMYMEAFKAEYPDASPEEYAAVEEEMSKQIAVMQTIASSKIKATIALEQNDVKITANLEPLKGLKIDIVATAVPVEQTKYQEYANVTSTSDIFDAHDAYRAIESKYAAKNVNSIDVNWWTDETTIDGAYPANVAVFNSTGACKAIATSVARINPDEQRVYLPLRQVLETAGFGVEWDQATSKAYAIVNGQKVEMTGTIYNDRTFVKIRDFEKIGATVEYIESDNGMRTARITLAK